MLPLCADQGVATTRLHQLDDFTNFLCQLPRFRTDAITRWAARIGAPRRLELPPHETTAHETGRTGRKVERGRFQFSVAAGNPEGFK